MNSWDRFVVFGNTLYYTAGSSSGQDEANLTWVLIGYPNGQDRPLFLAREFPLCSRKKKISWSYVKAAVKQSNLPGIEDSYLRGSNFCVLPFPKWNCRRVRGRDIVVGKHFTLGKWNRLNRVPRAAFGFQFGGPNRAKLLTPFPSRALLPWFCKRRIKA